MPDSRVCACTLFSAAGSDVAGRGVLIGKNRDQLPAFGTLKIVTPEGHGNRYLAVLYGTFPSMGINEKGLALVSATSPDRDETTGGSVNSVILSSYDSVAGVLSDLHSFSRYGSQFFIVADRYRTARIEIAPDTEQPTNVVATVTSNGVLAQTNHYLEQSFLHLNYDVDGNLIHGKPGTSSGERYARIAALLDGRLSGHLPPFDINDFVVFSRDHTEGDNNSVYRTACADDASGECTLATFIASMPGNGSPAVYVRLNNQYSGGAQHSCGFVMTDDFWTKWSGRESITCDYTISGRVDDLSTGRAIANAVISVRQSNRASAAPTPVAITDESGNYVAEIESAGDYIVSATKAGYVDYVQSGSRVILGNTSPNAVLMIRMEPSTASASSNSSSTGSGSSTSGGNGGCFIATAACGSYLHPWVGVLRAFRDRVLLASSPGRSFVEWYYRMSPPLAGVIARHGSLAAVVRLFLLPAVGVAWVWVNAGTTAALVALLLLGTGLFASARVVWKRM